MCGGVGTAGRLVLGSGDEEAFGGADNNHGSWIAREHELEFVPLGVDAYVCTGTQTAACQTKGAV